ncbi:MAG: hypothetical protein IT434_06950 [Phycisphaerales bacterium]|jgi:hypothetical protein|nr:hypothetical protein [Phycisphaerales bacterium]
MDPSSPNPQPAPVSRRQVVLRDLLDDLLWPKLLRAGAMSLRPERVAIAYLTILLVSLVMHAAALVPGAEAFLTKSGELFSAQADRATSAVMAIDLQQLGTAFVVYFKGLHELVGASPWVALACAAPWLLIAPLGASAICRLTAVETAHRVITSWPVGVGFALRAAKASILAVLGPVILLGLGVLGLAIVGAALFSVGGLGVVGALFFFIALAACAGMVLLGLGWVLGLPMFVPSVACEGPDPIDAVQRVLAYLVGRPLRIAAYSLVLIAELVIVASVVGIVVHATLDLASWGLTLFCGPDARAALSGHGDGLTGAWKSAARVAQFWREAFLGLVPAVVFSFVCSGWTIAYLLIRQLHDGQDRSEIWMPGMIPGTLAQDAASDDDDDE